ncbi:hypothetical protein GCM10010243_52440 [Streptomyces matensis]|nr:hypothetical protein GCM10010243_52440 [Streptomyces matensis]
MGWWCGAGAGVVVLGLARECVLERFRGRTRQPLRAPTPTPPLPAACGYTDTGGGASPAHCGQSCRWGGTGGRGGTSLAPRCADTPRPAPTPVPA